jgi:hypothetical protein
VYDVQPTGMLRGVSRVDWAVAQALETSEASAASTPTAVSDGEDAADAMAVPEQNWAMRGLCADELGMLWGREGESVMPHMRSYPQESGETCQG